MGRVIVAVFIFRFICCNCGISFGKFGWDGKRSARWKGVFVKNWVKWADGIGPMGRIRQMGQILPSRCRVRRARILRDRDGGRVREDRYGGFLLRNRFCSE